jgi:hypothetical protein
MLQVQPDVHGQPRVRLERWQAVGAHRLET